MRGSEFIFNAERHDLYLRNEVILLKEVFENFRRNMPSSILT